VGAARLVVFRWFVQAAHLLASLAAVCLFVEVGWFDGVTKMHSAWMMVGSSGYPHTVPAAGCAGSALFQACMTHDPHCVCMTVVEKALCLPLCLQLLLGLWWRQCVHCVLEPIAHG
jgi:hypothetical protein